MKRSFSVKLKLSDEVCVSCYHAHYEGNTQSWDCHWGMPKFNHNTGRGEYPPIYDQLRTVCKHYKRMSGKDFWYSKGGKQHETKR